MSKYLVFYGKNFYFAKLNSTKLFIMKGKQICKALKEIRLNIAQANDIEYTPAECNHKGDCLGTCPQCEKELRYIERQLLRRQTLGKAAVVAGLAIGATSIAPAMAQTHNYVPKVEQSKEKLKPVDCAPNDAAAIIVRGCIVDESTEPLAGATITVLDKKGKLTGTATDYFGQFAIRLSKDSKVQISYVGYKTVTTKFTEPEENLVIKMEDDDTLVGAVFIKEWMPDVDADIYDERQKKTASFLSSFEQDISVKRFKLISLALLLREADQIIALNTFQVLTMFTTLEQQWPDFIKEIEQHDAERAQELAEVFKQGFDDIAVRIWPKLQRIVAFGAGKFQSQTTALKRYAKSVTHNHGHLITIESLIAQAIADDSDLFELVLENDFFEFMPDNSEPLLLSQVSPGTTCEVIVTNRAGLYRYRTGVRISLVEHSPQGNAIIRIVE